MQKPCLKALCGCVLPAARTSLFQVMGPAHLRGCKCKRSRCVKKYCDCFDAQVRCSDMCK
jgi:hypothetical protein